MSVRKAELFDHLVGGSDQGRRNGEAEPPGVDDQLELGRLHDRQIRGLRALEDAARIDADLVIHFALGQIHTIAALVRA